MAIQTHFLHLLSGDFDSFLIFVRNQCRLDLQARRCCGVANVAQGCIERMQRFPRPVHADEAEQPMFDGIPFRCSSGIMADGDLQSVVIGQLLLKPQFPQPRTAAIAAASIGQDQDFGCRGEQALSRRFPPQGNAIHSKFRRVCRYPQVHVTSVVRQEVKSIGGTAALGVLEKIMAVHFLSFSTPGSSGVFEVTDQLFFLGIHADNGPTCLQETLLQAGNVAKLPISIWVRRTRKTFAVGFQRVAQFPQQTMDGLRVKEMTPFCQEVAQTLQAEANPLLPVHGVASRFFFQQAQQILFQVQTFFSRCRRPPPCRRTRPAGTPFSDAANSRRPDRIVRTFMPVISDNKRSPPCPTRFDSKATYQRRCC
jgi:hypothetical protein